MKENEAIVIENLGKTYKMLHGVKTEQGISRNLDVLKDVNLTILKGEIVGITGPNGSGKSTLLKILAGVTKPSAGVAYMAGKVASILDIGAGFQPELSGRDNIYISGEIIGFSRSEIREAFDKIIEFSGIGNFIDEPVKNYSNGMYLRLAFSIIIHLKCDILLLDEVLAVGDQQFMRKCIDAIKQKQANGATVVIVSHDRELLSYLTNRIITIKNKNIVTEEIDFFDSQDRFLADNNIQLAEIKHQVSVSSVIFEVRLENISGYDSVDVGLSFDYESSVHNRFIITSLHANHPNESLQQVYPSMAIKASIPYYALKPGKYIVSVYVIKNKHTVTANFNHCHSIEIAKGNNEDYFLHFYPNPLRMFMDWEKTNANAEKNI